MNKREFVSVDSPVCLSGKSQKTLEYLKRYSKDGKRKVLIFDIEAEEPNFDTASLVAKRMNMEISTVAAPKTGSLEGDSPAI